MEKIYNIISTPISVLHNAAVSSNDNNIISNYAAYITSYAEICRQKELTENNTAGLKYATTQLIKEVPEASKDLKKVLEILNEKKVGDDEIILEFEIEDPVLEFNFNKDFTENKYSQEEPINLEFEEILGSLEEVADEQEFYKNIEKKMASIASYIESHIAKYKISAYFTYSISINEVSRSIRFYLNNDMGYSANLDDDEDILLSLSAMLDIIDYLDYEIIKDYKTNTREGYYEGFTERVDLKKSIHDEIEKSIKEFKKKISKSKKIRELSDILDKLDYLISPTNKSTCIRKLINFVGAINRGDESALKYTKGKKKFSDLEKFITIY